jgi:HSP20 family protein
MAEEAKQGNVSVEMKKDPAAEPKGGPVRRFDEFEQDMERLYESFLSRNWLRPFRDLPSLRHFEGRMPRVDVLERDGEIAVRAELPGVEKKDLTVTLSDRSVTIQASTRTETKEEKGEYYRREISTGQVSRTVTLPADVDGTKAKAEFKDGLLEILIPKTKKSSRVKVDVK